MIDFEITDSITPEEYMQMRRNVHWGEFPLEQAAVGLKNSFILICLRNSEGQPIGLGRAVSDGGYVIYIADVIVCSDYQGQGLGRVIMETLMERIRKTLKPGYRVMVSLLSAKDKEEFYDKFGFEIRPNETYGCGMHQWLGA
ncbi:MAG: GNAT family N-acetyltransferase [Ruminococcaceae bacterium]|nr:GNAT family N-acetyltransferase [Oscillospiraceae bacterium]